MPTPFRVLLRAWLPAVGWAAFIFFLSTRQAGNLPPPWILSNDKVVHALLFGLQSLFIYYAVRKGHRRSAWVAAVTGFILASLYGATDEIHQVWTPTRVADVWDWVADAVGAACVFVLALLPSRHDPAR